MYITYEYFINLYYVCLLYLLFIMFQITYIMMTNIETLVNVEYNINKPYNKGMGYPDIKVFAPFAYENMGNTIRYPDKIDDQTKRQDALNSLYGNNEESFDERQVEYERNDKLYSDQKIYQDIMFFNSASNTLRNSIIMIKCVKYNIAYFHNGEENV